MNEDDLIRTIEELGEDLTRGSAPQSLTVDLRSERITLRLTMEEAKALDRSCKRLGVGRSTLIRMGLRQVLIQQGELDSTGHQQAAATRLD